MRHDQIERAVVEAITDTALFSDGKVTGTASNVEIDVVLDGESWVIRLEVEKKK